MVQRCKFSIELKNFPPDLSGEPGSTDWEEMTGFMNLRIRKGEEAALLEYDSLGKSLSVYGVSVKDSGGTPHWEMTIMDSWELTLTN